MDCYNFAIEFENGNVRIYKYDCGIVLEEPAKAIISNKSGDNRVIEVGDDALQYMGKLDKSHNIVSPIVNARIEDIDICTQMLNFFLNKVEDNTFRKKRNLIFLVPCGLKGNEIEQYRDLGYSLSARKVKLVTKVQAVSLYNSLKDKLANMILHMGQDFLDVAIMYDRRIVTGYTIDLGSQVVMENLRRYLLDNRNIEVSEKEIKNIFNDLATILPNDDIEEKYVGVDNYTKSLCEFKISSLDVIDVYTNYINEICDVVDVIMKSLSKEILAELKVSGLILTGNITHLTGLVKYLKNRLGLPVIISDKPNYSALLGIGSILNNIEEIDNMSIN